MTCKILFSGRGVEFIFGDAWDKSLVEGGSNFSRWGWGGANFQRVCRELPAHIPPSPLEKTLTIKNGQILLYYCFNKIIKGPGTSFQSPE